MQLDFYKYHGTGNDFVILDNRQGKYDKLGSWEVKFLCHRRFGVGADGLMLLNKKDGYDFEMKYYNADGREGSMCGNGGRCLVKFAYDLGLHKSEFKFAAIDGDHHAEIEANGTIRLKMKDVAGVDYRFNSSVLNTGSPHLVKLTPELADFDVTLHLI